MHQDSTPVAFARIVQEVTSVSQAEVTGDERLREDLGIDSLSLIDMAVAAEDMFGIRVPDEDLEGFRTIDDAVEYIRRAVIRRCLHENEAGHWSAAVRGLLGSDQASF
jgi:acyl carrier protein